MGDSDNAKVGQQVIAIGNALGYGQSVTVGYVSALDRQITDENGIVHTYIPVSYTHLDVYKRQLLNRILHDHLKKIFLGHLSKENNYPELAYETVRLEIDEGDCPYGASDFSISVASRDRMSDIVYL